MTNYASGTKLTDLSLVAEPVPAVDAPAPVALPVSAGVSGNTATNTDGYLAEATREYDAGSIDQALWAKALELAGNNVAAAKPAYLRARAAALWVTRRTKSAEKPPSRPRKSTRDKRDPQVARRRKRSMSRRAMLIAGAFFFVVVVTGALVLRPSNAPPEVVARGTEAVRSAPRKAPVPVNAGDSERISASGDDFGRKVSELKAAGNWNVLVLYAVEWTRKAPGNADAWNELSMGYVKLRQFNDALEAAAKAAQLAPKNPQIWQNLGEINVAVQQPAAALSAYEQAVALNGRDVTSLVQTGMLNAELGRLPDAKAAFAQVLAMNPLDVDALCGTESIAQKEGRPKEAEAVARQLKAADLRCREAAVVMPVAPAAAPGAKKKPASSGAR